MTKPSPNVESESRAPLTSFQAIRPTRTSRAERGDAGGPLQEEVAQTQPAAP